MGIEAPSPPWDRTRYEILVPIPIAYDLGTGLDGFDIALPYSFGGVEHNRVNGQTVTVEGRQWRAVPGTTQTANNLVPGLTLSRATSFTAEDSS